LSRKSRRRTPLANAPDAPAGWLRDLAVFHAAYGDAMSKSGDRPGAVIEWRRALELVRRQQAISQGDPRLADDARTLEGEIATGRRVRTSPQ
jgi:hypothetical protein